MRLKLLLPIGALILSIPTPASCDEAQKMTVEQMVDKCSAADSNSAAFCIGLATGVLSQLQGKGAFFRIASDETRNVLKVAGVACGAIEPKLALMAFIGWAKIHPELRGYNGIVGISTAIEQAWPCGE
jgi:Rap1a immunity proteins